jgi:uncharacterized protein
MTANYRKWAKPLAAGIFLIGLSACAALSGPNPPVNYYVLNAATAGSPAGVGQPQHGPLIGVAPVSLPAYLDQPGITTRGAGNEVVRADYDRWAGPLGSEVTRVVGENLALMVPTDRLTTALTGRSIPLDFLVEIEIVTFERDQTGAVQLIARWSLFSADGNNLVTMQTSRISRPTAGADYDSDAAAMSSALEALCAEIASAIRENAATRSTAKPPAKATK